MLLAKSGGDGIQSGSSKKNGSRSRMQPIGSLGPTGRRRYFSIRRRISSRVAVPFFGPKESQAKLQGRKRKRTKKPPPTMKSSGLCSLKSSGSPGASALKVCSPPGFQKFTSSTPGRPRRKRNQELSVTAIRSRMGVAGAQVDAFIVSENSGFSFLIRE